MAEEFDDPPMPFVDMSSDMKEVAEIIKEILWFQDTFKWISKEVDSFKSRASFSVSRGDGQQFTITVEWDDPR